MFCTKCGAELLDGTPFCTGCGEALVPTKYCPKCGERLPEDAKVCIKCKALQGNAKFCQHCGEEIDKECVVCPKCGKQVMEFQQQTKQPQVVINNTSTNTNTNTAYAYAAGGHGIRPRDKWVAFLLCLFLGYFGAHKFYEGKAALGVIYLFTFGVFFIGWFIDLIIILTKPNPYFV